MADAVHHADHPHADGHHAGHLPFMAHHFDTPVQQFSAGKLGMWLFLATEVLFFSGLFCAYAIYRRNHPEIFEVGHKHLDVFWGAFNTVVLILSSFTMALGVYFAQRSNRTGLIVCLALTLAGALGFMVVKYVEYSAKFQHGTLWGYYYKPHEEHHGESGGGDSRSDSAHAPAKPDAAHAPAAAAPATTGSHAAPTGTLTHSSAAGGATTTTVPPTGTPTQATPPSGAGPAAAPIPEKSQLAPPAVPPTGVTKAVLAPDKKPASGGAHSAEEEAKNVHIFFGIYFCMTGLHGIHVLAGVVMLVILLWGAILGKYDANYYTPVDLGGLYWHIVDLVWIYLFPLLYLIH